MPTLTARLKLIKAALTDTVDVIGFLDANMDLLDGLVPNTLCTSLSRPASPFDGQVIWESDTDVLRIWSDNTSRWVQVTPRQLLSTDARPSGAFLGDRLFETDTGITRVWNGTRYKPLGSGNEYYAETGAGNFAVAGNPQWGFTPSSTHNFTADGLTPYDFEVYCAGWFENGGTPNESDQIAIQIQYSTDGGSTWPNTIMQVNPTLGHAVLNRVTNPVFARRNRVTLPASSIQVRVNCTQSQGTNAVIYTNSGAPFFPAFLRVVER